MLPLSSDVKAWVAKVSAEIVEKESRVIKKSGEKIPYTTENGVFDDKFANDPSWWTNGFYIGILWLMYIKTGDSYFSDLANRLEEKLDIVLYDPELLYHDVGFMWGLSSVANYRLTGNKVSGARALTAANSLVARFNPAAGFITAWNGEDKESWSIVDCMMNLPLLYWATEVTGYRRFKDFGILHADKTMEHVVRTDGSAIHIIDYNLDDGSVVQTFGGQGYGVGSSWTRGQSWALYGFALSYLRTGEIKYLDTAKKIANYFIASVSEHGFVPPVDFRSPPEPYYVDTTAGAIAACGMIEISKHCEAESNLYLNAAVKILQAMTEKYADFSENSDAILHGGSEGYLDNFKKNIDIIYGDYFFVEALFMLDGMDICLW